MRYFLLLGLIIGYPLPLVATDEPEIVIELTGTPSVTQVAKEGIEIWNKNSQQIAKLLKGKTREQALYQITSVSTKDVTISSGDGKRYRFVQYGREGGYRKLLFQVKEPQLFIACATTAQESLDITLAYQVDIGFTETEFLEAFSAHASSVYLPASSKYTLYQISEKGKESQFVQFSQGKPVARLNQAQSQQLIKDEQQRQRNEIKARQEARKREEAQKKKQKTFTALVEGGTLHDRMYMPRVVSPSQTLKLIPSKKTPGKHIW